MNYIDFSNEVEIKAYFTTLPDLEHSEENTDHCEQMCVHLKGASPEKLLGNLRPNEPKDILKYRLDTYEPTTKSHGKRILNTLSKVQKQSSYSINIEKQTNIKENETLEVYINDYPIFSDLFKWIFDSALEYSLCDPNAIVVYAPIEIPKTDTSYFKPVGQIYPSKMVVDEGHNYITLLIDENHTDKHLNIYLIVTEKSILKVTQVKHNVYNYEILHSYEFNRTPYFKLGGDIISGSFPVQFESFISGILPYWNKAVRLESDLDAAYVLHMYPERVEMETECSERGCSFNENNIHVKIVDGKEVNCHSCGGSGKINGRSPYGVTTVKKEEGLDLSNSTIFPGVQYIEKNTNIVELVEKKVESLIKKGFSSINLEVLDTVGENQSGVAKVIDRDAMNSFFTKVSNNLYDNIFWNSLELISLWRYNSIVPFTINKPVNFDYSSIESLTNDLKNLKESKSSAALISQTEIDLIEKKYFGLKNKISKDCIDLDPYYSKTEEEKANMILAGGINRPNYVISSNIYPFILRAYNEIEGFELFERVKKLETLNKYADEFIKSTKTVVAVEVQPDGQGG